MKKLVAICLTIVMVASLGLSVLAAPNGFVSSPSGGKRPPVLDRFDPVDDDCTADLVITPYGDKDDLPEDERKEMEDAYNDIVNSDKLTDLNKELEETAKDKNIDPENLAVGDLIHLGCDGCDDHENHKDFEISLDAEGLDKFVGVIYRDEDGNWHWIDDAKVNDGKLQFTGKGYHPYAIVLDTTVDESSKTGDSNIIAICVTVMAVTAVALVVVLVVGKKRHA